MLLSWRKEADLRRVGAIAATFFLLLAGLLLHRYFTYYASYDQGIFNQVFWNNAHGNFFQSTLSSQLSTDVIHSGELPRVDYRRLGQHFTPALLFWWPIYRLFPSPVTLSVLQAAFAAIAGVPLLSISARATPQPQPARLVQLSRASRNRKFSPSHSFRNREFPSPAILPSDFQSPSVME